MSKLRYYCCNYITSKSGTRHNRLASFILYDSSRNFTRKNKNISMFSTEFHSKIRKSWYYCCNCVTSKSTTRHIRFSFLFYMNPTLIHFSLYFLIFWFQFDSNINFMCYCFCIWICIDLLIKYFMISFFILYIIYYLFLFLILI